ncbi:MAG: AAA family ATPase [Bermanella sp.]
MLRDLTQIKGSIINTNALNDFKLPTELKLKFKSLLNSQGYEFNDYTSYAITDKASEAKPANFAVIPNQYLLFSCQVYELAMELYKYFDIFDCLRPYSKKLVGNESYIYKQIKSDPEMLKFINDDNDISLFSKFLDKEQSDYRLGSKRLINDQGSPRGSKDCFGSVILKEINLPDSSSSIFGRLVYDLCSNQSLYDELLLINDSLKTSFSYPKKEHQVILSNSSIRDFAFDIFDYFYKENWLDVVSGDDTRESNINGVTFRSKDFGPFKRLIGIFESQQDRSTLTSSGAIRFFETPIYSTDKQYFYFSSQWNGTGEYSLSFDNLKSFFEFKFSDYILEIYSGDYRLCKKFIQYDNGHEYVNGASNVIFYGAPGTGKSYSIDKIVREYKHVTTVFHPDTQYNDFVGCLKPSMNGSNIEYKFRDGPFCKALKISHENKNEHCYLVIEEINRASAAAVFGEIFQLLDRDSTGDSRYGVNISDPDMLSYLAKNAPSVIQDGKLKLPPNLSIYATMNSSDQAVMPMDTAFKRRWKFNYKSIDFSECAKGKLILPIDDTNIIITWKNFAENVNGVLIEQGIPEDRLLGPWFLQDGELTEESAQDAVAGKLFMYLWDDVLRHGQKTAVFDESIKNYGQLVHKFKTGEPVFNEILSSKFEAFSEKRIISSVKLDDNPVSNDELLVAEPAAKYSQNNVTEEK